jgi:glyoxylate utilization-related uncharacterized protein
LQLGGGPPRHAPPEQVSFVVHALPSLQGRVLGVFTQPIDALQLSSVQTLPSLQLGGGPPRHDPPEQVSAVVQALPSLHGAVLLTWTQPLDGLQVSSVQPLPSLQLSGGPPAHDPPEQVSAVVHALPSLHGAVLFVCTQPLDGLQLSSVQPLPSLQSGGGPPTHDPLAHVSAVVQALWSSQGPVLFWCTQPLSGLQLSSVQTFASSQ